MPQPVNQWIMAHPVQVICYVALCAMLSLMGLFHFQSNNDLRIFFSEHNPNYQHFVAFEEEFGSSETLVFVVKPAGGTIFTRKVLEALVTLSEQAWDLPYATRVDSVTNYQHTFVEGDTLSVRHLVASPLTYSDDALAEVRDVALGSPFLRHHLISPSGHVTAVVVTVSMTAGHSNASDITLAAEQVAEAIEQGYPFLDVMLTGSAAFSHAAALATEQTLTYTLPLAWLAMVLLLYVLLRSVLFTLVVMLVVLLSVGMSTGLAVHLGIMFSPLVAMAPAMVLTLAMADCVHVLSGYQRYRLQGMGCETAMLRSLKANRVPIWLTSITTLIGFAVLNFSDSQPIRALGNVVMLGVIVALVLALVLLPALIRVLPHRINAVSQWHLEPVMTRFSKWVLRYHRVLLAGMSVLVLGLTVSAFQNRINDVFTEYFDETFEFRQVNDFYAAELSGMHRLDYALDAGAAYGVLTPVYLARLDQFVSWLRQQEHVVYAASYSDMVKQIHRDMHQGDEAYYRIPDSTELISQYTLMLEMSLPQGLGLDNLLSHQRDRARVVVLLESIGSTPLRAFDKRVQQWMQAHFPAGMQSNATGLDLLFSTVTLDNMKSLLLGALVAVLCVFVLVCVGLRSMRYSLISLLPNLLPAVMAFGVWAWLVGEVGLTVSVVACMTLGIVVDDTVHFINKYVHARRHKQLKTAAAITHAFQSTGVAIVITSVVLVVNFSIIGMSHFYPSASLGQLSAWAIAIALLVDFLFFVPLLIWLDLKKENTQR